MNTVQLPLWPCLFLLFFSGLKTSAQSNSIRFQENPEWEKVLKQAGKEDKLIFVDGYTSWCAPCKLMEREVFVRPAEADYFNRTFINVKYDMERGEGANLKKQYGIQGFPTYLFVNESGQVVHRIFGAFTADGEFLSYAKLALTPGETTEDMERRYRNGERSPGMMFGYLRMLRLTGQQAKEKDLAKDYLALITKDHFMDSSYWRIIKHFIKDPMSREFKLLMDNREELAARLGKEEVDAKIFTVLDDQIRKNKPGESGAYDKAAEEQLIQYLQNADFPRRNELLAKALLTRHSRHFDWHLYASVADAMLDFNFLKNSNDPLRDLNDCAATIEKVTFDKALLKRALRWAEYTCQHETRTREKDDFEQTRARLLLKIGN